jgi:SAM-dependent methyltransferase
MARSGSRYGVDAPAAVGGVSAGAGLTLAVAVRLRRSSGPRGRALGGFLLVSGAIQALSAATSLHTALRGKIVVWDEEVAALGLTGTERVLDLGCGRGMLLIAIARRLTTGRATGVDLWQTRDQSGNDAAATRCNAQRAGVGDRIDLVTGDLRALPLPNGSFDVVVSSLAVHNIPDEPGRAWAIREAWRVLAPGGRLRLAEVRQVPAYAGVLHAAGATDVQIRDLGPRFWHGGPWGRTLLLAATKPDPDRRPG